MQLLFLTFTSLLLFFNGCILYFTQEDFIKKAFNSLGLLHYEWCYNPINPMNKKTVVKMSLFALVGSSPVCAGMWDNGHETLGS